MMTVREHEQIEQLEAYLGALERDPTAVPPAGLDNGLAQTAQRVLSGLCPPEPGVAFVSKLRRQLLVQAAEMRSHTGPAPARWPGWWQRLGQLVRSATLARVAAATLVVAALVAASYAITRPQPVSAQAIIQKVQATSASPTAGGVRTFVLTEVSRYRLANGRLDTEGSESKSEEMVTETRRWYRAPDRYRSETEERALQPDGTETRRFSLLHVNDGRDIWLYYPDENRAVVNRPSPDKAGVSPEVSPFSQSVGDLNALLQQANSCYEPKIMGNATVAGRSTYVIDLGPTRCAAGLGDTGGRSVIWVDQETFFALKQELYSTQGDRLIWQSEVTSVQYNVPVDEALFTFTPPAEASVLDLRNQALPTLTPFTPAAGSSATPGLSADPQRAALLAVLEPLAREVDYPLFAPERIPAGLVPRLPKLQPLEEGVRQLWLDYVPAGEVERDTMPTLRISEQRATYDSVVRGTNGAIPIAIEVGKAWVRRDFRADKGGTDSRVFVLRDGTLLTIKSDTMAAENLLEIASSLEAVAGGHAPLAEPQPPTLAELRAQAPYPIFVPTWVPEGLMPDPPATDNGVGYYDAEGRLALTVSNNPDWVDDPRNTGELVALPNGLTAHWLVPGQILWWIQEGMPVALTGPNLTRDELIKVAASMSKTAELGSMGLRPQPTPAPVLPTPTPMPTPTFRVLRPTWLPGPMTLHEQVDGDIVTLGFDPQPGGGMHDVLALYELPLRLISDGSDDPQATTEQIGDYTVTVIRRGQDCVTYTWDAGGLRLTLSNVYDAQGQLKYSCEEMRRIVESVR